MFERGQRDLAMGQYTIGRVFMRHPDEERVISNKIKKCVMIYKGRWNMENFIKGMLQQSSRYVRKEANHFCKSSSPSF